MPPLFREQHLKKRPVRRARGLYRALIDLAVLVHRAHEIAVAFDDLFRLVVRDLEGLDEEVSPVRVAEHDVKHRIAPISVSLLGGASSTFTSLPRTMP